ncbi:MAG: molybdate ABC transporter substrate-binding protein [Actinomycetota bacterium]
MRRILVMLSTLLALCACGKTSQVHGSSGGTKTLRILAAASLSPVFTEIARNFEHLYQGVKVEVSFAGSQILDAQIEQGAPADVFASADVASMTKVQAFTGTPFDFARNIMTIAVEKGNPKHVTGLSSLARKDLIVVLCNDSVPCGKLAAKILGKARVGLHASSYEDNVKGVVTKIQTGEADAGIVYVTDVQATVGALGSVLIPQNENAVTTYQIARLRSSSEPTLADQFIAFVRSPVEQDDLAFRGFLRAA